MPGRTTKIDKPKGDITVACHRCGTTRETGMSKDGKRPLLGRGWRSVGDGPHAGLWCEECWKDAFVPRSITIPVSGPVGIVRPGNRREVIIDPADWKGLRLVLRECWRQSTSVANWAVTELARADSPRTAEMDKLPPAPSVYLYPGAKLVAPGMDSQAIIAILNNVTLNYKAKRYDVMWLRKAAFPSYRYPYPYLVDRDGWNPVKDPKSGRPAVSVRLGGQRWILRLAGGFRNRRKIDGWKRIFNGEAIAREIAIESDPVTKSDHRSGITAKEPGGGQTQFRRVMVRISAWLPRQKLVAEPGNVMLCKTSATAFLAYQVGSDGEPRYVYGDHVRRWRNQSAERNRRFAHDMKHEKRWTANQRRAMRRRQDQHRIKFQNRMDTFLNEATKVVAEYAYRQKVAKVIFDMSDQGFGGSDFPWFMLKELMARKLHERRIDVEIIGYKDTQKEAIDNSEAEQATCLPRVRKRNSSRRGQTGTKLSVGSDGA